MEDDQGELALWLETAMRARRLSQRRLAAMSGVSSSTISRIVTMRRSAHWRTVLRLAEAIGEPPPGLAGTATATDAPARVERALAADRVLGGADRAEVMRFYLAVRTGGIGPLEGSD